MKRGAAVAAALLVLVAAAPAAASPEDVFGFGPRGPAMGGTGIAHASDFDAVYANPALLSRLRERRLSLGFQGATFHLRADGPDAGGRVPAQATKELVIGATYPIPFGGTLRDRVAIGLAFSTPTSILVRGRIIYPESPQFPLLPDRTQSLTARAGLGVDLGHGVRAGVAMAMLAQLAGYVNVASDAYGRVGSNVQTQLTANYGPVLGLSYERALGRGNGVGRVGLVYRGALVARFAIDVDATRLSSLQIPILHIAGVAQYDPAQLGLEAAWERGPWILAAGVTYKRWSSYPGLVSATIRCPDDEPDCGALSPGAPGYSDTLVPRVGAELMVARERALDARVRAGYALEPSPVPARLEPGRGWDPASRQTVYLPNRSFDVDRHLVTVGGGVALREPLPVTLDLYAQLHLLPSRDQQVLPGPGGEGVGRFGTVEASGHVLVGGLLVGLVF